MFLEGRRTFILILIILPAINHLVFAGPIVIAGSSGESPPPFWENSFWGMTESIEMAFPFMFSAGEPYFVEELEVAAYHYDGMAGSVANFSINLDDNGHPAQAVAIFEMTGITTTQKVVSTLVTQEVILYSDVLYWLVGGTPHGQVNWNLAAGIFGTAAKRVEEGDWVILSNSNVSAFAILGSPVPEPATLLLLGLGGLILRRKHRT